MDYEDEVISELSTDECWKLLRGAEFGRLAYLLGDEINIAPINYAVDGQTLLFETAEGSKLLGIVMNPHVVFETDRYSNDIAESVIVRGRARLLEEDEAHRIENVSLRPWVETLKYNVVEIVPSRLTGRRFHLNRRPERARDS
jgi:uncharacterized protein